MDASRRGARYARISDDRAADEHGVKNQLGTQAAYALARGITIGEGHTFTDNDISATYGAPRPGYQALMQAVIRGEIDVIIVFQTSRLWRNRRERAEGIEILRKAGVSVEATKGPSLDMSTAYGRGMAGLLGEFDTMETEVKSERQVLAAQERAKSGRMPAGVRAFGFMNADDPLEVPTWCVVATRKEFSEAEMVRAMFARFHAGDSLIGTARWLEESSVPTRHGGAWSANTVRQILVNPRYKGTVVYRHRAKEGPGGTYAGAFPALVDEHVWEAVNERLADPRRRKSFHTERKYLGGGLYLCGWSAAGEDKQCGRRVRSHGGSRGPAYACAKGHMYRLSEKVDAYVLDMIRARIGQPDAARLASLPSSGRAAEITAELRTLKRRIQQTKRDYDSDLIDGERYHEKTAKLEAETAALEAARLKLTAGSEVGGVLGSADPVKAFDEAPLGIKRSVIGFFCTVEILPVAKGTRNFSRRSVRITPKDLA